MKTLSEAMDCINRRPTDSQGASVQIGEDGAVVVTVQPGPMPKAGASLIEIGRECGTDDKVDELRNATIGQLLEDNLGTRHAPLLMCKVFDAIFLTAFSYGVLIGIEMERQELLDPVTPEL